MKSFDWRKVGLLVFALTVASITAYYGQPLIHKNENAINMIVTIFSILSGFLIAIIALIGDPMLLSSGSWRAAEMDERKINQSLIRHKMLFELYLLTLASVFVTLLWPDKDPQLIMWLERGMLFLGTLAFIYSFQLPRVLIESQQERIDAEIKRRRNEVGIKP